MLQTSIIHGQQAQPVRKLNLARGQLFQGKVLKLFPHHLAALSVRGMTVTAKLEAALSANQMYWFEVKQAKGIPVLKVLEQLPSQQYGTAQINGANETANILSQLGIHPSKGNQLLLTSFLREQLPISKEWIELGGKLLEQHKALNDTGLKTLQQMAQRNLPFTTDVFQAIQAVLHGESLSSLLQQAMADIDNLPSKNEATATISRALQTFTQGTAVVAGPNGVTGLFHMMAMSNQEVAEGAFALLKRTGLFSEHLTKDDLYVQFKAAILNPNNKGIIEKLWPDLKIEIDSQKAQRIEARLLFDTLISKLQTPNGQQRAFPMQQLLQLFQSSISFEQVESNYASITKQPAILETGERAALQRLMLDSVPHSVQQVNRHPLGFQLLQIVQQLGMQQEANLLEIIQGNASDKKLLAELTSLKTEIMLSQRQLEDLPHALKDKLEAVVHRITGQQLIAAEQNGPLQQLIINIPLVLGGFHTDLTMQWEGKKTKKGELDPEHCRILFYIELEQLKETIIDVQIQKRIVSIHVYNEQACPQHIIDQIQPFLKSQLELLDYQLSTITWKKPQNVSNKVNASETYQYAHYHGVDVRI